MIGPKAYIAKDKLERNIKNIRTYIGPKKLMIVVKANGYGHGLLNVASILSSQEDIILCVFNIQEAILLRENGVRNNIFIFSRIQQDWVIRAFELNLWVNICHWDDLLLVDKIISETGLCPKIHLKFDTGMTRLGFDITDSEKVFNFLRDRPKIPIEGIYSHFSTADEGDISFAEKQLTLFNDIVLQAKRNGIIFKYIHCSNSGALLNLPDSYFNTLRVGMLAYGVSPSDEVKMKIDVEPVMSFCGPVVNLRRVESGTSVSYGGVYKTKKETNIGVVQIGFADGLPRQWYEDGFVSYEGNYFNIAGRICMDQFMVDFREVKPNMGDEVLIFGKKKKDEIPIETIAKKIKTTTYVLLTAIQGRTEHITI